MALLSANYLIWTGAVLFGILDDFEPAVTAASIVYHNG